MDHIEIGRLCCSPASAEYTLKFGKYYLHWKLYWARIVWIDTIRAGDSSALDLDVIFRTREYRMLLWMKKGKLVPKYIFKPGQCLLPLHTKKNESSQALEIRKA